MDATLRQEHTGTPPRLAGESRLWLLPVLGLALWHGWMILTLFGPGDPWAALRDDRPILSGQHALHLYHGHLGARAFLRHGSTSCYDPAFQAGYPKTPVFDGGSRPAELFLLLAGGEFRPSYYKVGLAGCCLLVPLVVCIASRGIGLSRRAVFLSATLGLMVWWGGPVQEALHEGNLDLLLASLASLALSGLLIRYTRKPGGRAYLGALLAGILGWLFHPVLLALLLPIFLVYYLSVGARHRMIWSILLLGGLVLAVAANYFWLRDWVRYWWLRVPLSASELLPHRTLASLWRAPLWGEPLDRGLTLVLIGLGSLGVLLLNQGGNRPAARLFGLSALTLILLAIGGVLNEVLGKFSVTSLLVPGLLFSVPLAAHAVERGWVRYQGVLRGRWALLSLALVLAGSAVLLPGLRADLGQRCTAARPLQLGWSPAQSEVIQTLQRHTTAEARILWENTPRDQLGAGWTPLLPLLCERSFMGGLDPSQGIEHTCEGLCRQRLAGRQLDEWSDDALAEYCWRYNIGWIVCWSAPARERFERWPLARCLGSLARGEGTLFAVQRAPSFVLRGKARWLGAELNRIRLADVVPENSEILLSLHHQKGLVVSPARVKIEHEVDPRQDIPFVRLRVTAPVSHLTLTWQK